MTLSRLSSIYHQSSVAVEHEKPRQRGQVGRSEKVPKRAKITLGSPPVCARKRLYGLLHEKMVKNFIGYLGKLMRIGS
jgi:hypothetical protein